MTGLLLRRPTVTNGPSPRPQEELPRTNAKAGRKPLDRVEGQVFQSTLDSSDIVRRDPHLLGKLRLGQAECPPKLGRTATEVLPKIS